MNNYFGAMLRYFEFNGRSTRSEYWWFMLGVVLAAVAAVIVDVEVFHFRMPRGEGFSLLNGKYGPASMFVIFTHTIPSITVTVRRLHDTGRSGWWYLLALVPFGGLVILFFTLQGAGDEADRFGPDPRLESEPTPARLARHQPLTRAQLMVQQMDERRRRMT